MDKNRIKRASYLLPFLLLGVFYATSPYSAVAQADKPAEVEADKLTYLEKESKILATGNVEVKYDARTLKAGNVVYDQENNIVAAEGNVHFMDGKGNNYYADKAKFDDKLTSGTIDNLSGKLADGSNIAATRAIRKTPELTILENAVFSPCKICKRRNKGKPVWQISASKVTIDENKERISYKHATFDVLGVPILYSPYISHATPGAEKRNGFLIPSYSSINTLGITLKTPYYFNLAPNRNLIVEPIFTTQEGTILSGEYNHLVKSGRYYLKASITNPKERDEFGQRAPGREIRGHIEGRGNFSIVDDWTWGFEAKRSTDDTYLRRYKFGNEDLLTSRLFLENMSGRNYFGAQGISFQGLNVADDPDSTPLIAPLVNAHYETASGYKGSRFTLDANAMSLTRTTGVDSSRLSATAGWNVPYSTKSGHIFKLNGSIRGDVYHVDNVIVDTGMLKEGTKGRVIPQVELGWSFPLVKHGNSSRLFIEPAIDLILSPNGNNPDTIPNEDSQEIELSDVNLFSANRFTGLDRVESGPRVNYGLRGGIFNRFGELDFLVGQSYRAKVDSNFTPVSGLDDNFSDYVGRVSVRKDERVELSYRFRVDKDSYIVRRNEAGLDLNLDPVTFSTRYVLLDEEDESFDRQELLGSVGYRFSEYWVLSANGRRDLNDNGGWVTTGASLVYEDECIRFSTGWSREYLRDRDIEPSISYLFQVTLKHLGLF